MNLEIATKPALDLPLSQKVEFLSRADSYSSGVEAVERCETHMSWVFLAGDTVYKLKKPVRFPYLDFSTLERREAACRAELRLNRRLAPAVYLDVVPLRLAENRLAIGGRGDDVDWLVVMRRLDPRQTLECALREGRLDRPDLDRLIATLARFYRSARPLHVPVAAQLSEWHRRLDYNRRILLDPALGLAAGQVRRIDAAQRKFLVCHRELFAARLRARRFVDGHGDLRPEHIWLNKPVAVIDCLEFNPVLRAVDPADDVGFLSLECARLGAAWAGEYLERGVSATLRDTVPEELTRFYRCHRAMLRARLAIAHLLDGDPRRHGKWLQLTQTYLAMASAEALALERWLRRPAGRRAYGFR